MASLFCTRLTRSGIARVMLSIIAVATLLLLTSAGLLCTPAGRQLLLDVLARTTAGPNFRLQLHGLDIGQTWSLREGVIADRDGPWLTVHDLHLQASLSQLLGGHVASLRATEVRWLRRPLPGTGQGQLNLPRLTVAQLELPRVHLDRPVAGQDADLRASGDISLTGDTVRARLLVMRPDKEDHLNVRTLYHLPGQQLEVHAELREQPGGLLHTLLHAEGNQGITLRIDGHGTPDALPLTLQADCADLLRSNGTGTLLLNQGRPTLNIALAGDLGPRLSHMLHLTDPYFSATATLLQDGSTLHLTGLDVQHAAASVNGTAAWEVTDRRLTAEISMATRDLSGLLPPQIRPGPTSTNATLILTPDALNLDATTLTQQWTIHGHPMERAEVNGSLYLPFQTDTWSINATTQFVVADLPEGLRTARTQMQCSMENGTLRLTDFTLSSHMLDLRAHGSVNATAELYGDLRLRDLPVWSGGPLLSGACAVTASGIFEPGRPAFHGNVLMAADHLRGLPQAVHNLLGANPTVRAEVTLDPTILQARQFQLLGAAQTSGSAQLELANTAYDVTASVMLPTLGVGMATLTGGSADTRITGTGNNADLRITLRAPRLNLPTLALQPLTAEARLQTNGRNLHGSVQATGQAGSEPFTLRSMLQVDRSCLQLHNATLDLNGATLHASGSWPFHTSPVQGHAFLHATDLRPLGRILHHDLEGTFDLEANLKSENHVHIHGQGSRLHANGFNARNCTVDLQSTPGTLALTVDGLSYADTPLGKLQAEAAGTPAAIHFTARSTGPQHALNVAGTAEHTAPNTRLTISSLDGTLARQRVHLDTPVLLHHNDNGTDWPETALRLGQSSLTTSGRLGTEHLTVHATLNAFNPALLRPLRPDLPDATVSGRLSVQGPVTNPDTRFWLDLDNLHLESSDLENMPLLRAHTDVRRTDGRMTADVSLSASDQTVNATGQLSYPVRPGLLTFAPEPDAPLAGTFHTSTQLNLIPHLFLLDDQILSGTGNADFRLAGTSSLPTLHGTGSVRDARYENFRTGTRLEHLDINATALDSALRLNFGATDGAQGTILGNGTMDLGTGATSITAAVQTFQSLRTDLATGTTSGHLRLLGTRNSVRVEGELTLDQTAVRLPAFAPAGLSHVEVKEINVEDRHQPQLPRQARFRPELDVRLNVPARLYVHGRGLDSEWTGQVRLTGTSTAPRISGQLQILRGRFAILDRDFDLTKGVLTLDGQYPPNPFLEVTGETTIQDVTISAQILGPTRDFRLTLVSSPALPQDELLAMILFGRSMRQISPLQAVQLAQAAANLTGVHGLSVGLDAIDTLKSKLGLRELEVGKDEKDNTAIGLGGYVGGKYYVRTQRSLSGKDRTKVEVQLTPKISVETEMGADSHNGGGVTWKHDY